MNFQLESETHFFQYVRRPRSVDARTMVEVTLELYTRATQGVRVIKCNRFPRQKGVMVPGVPCVDRGNWGQDLALCEYSVLRRIFWQESGLILWCHIQRCRSFSEGVGPRIIVLESQSGKQSSRLKRSREITTEPSGIEWVQTTKILQWPKNRQSTTVCSYCCYYLNITVKQII